MLYLHVSWLLRTDVCAAYLSGEDSAVKDRLLALPVEQVYLASVVRAELFYAARRSEAVESNLRALDDFFAPLGTLPFDDAAAARYGAARAELGAGAGDLSLADLQLAATALAADAVLVTRDDRGLRRVPGLRVEVW